MPRLLRCLRGEKDDVRSLDYRNCALTQVPSDVFSYERSLEELLLDSNQVTELPPELFACLALRKLCVSDNDIKTVPAAVGNLTALEHFDISKNGIHHLSENISQCKFLRVLEASINPLNKLNDGFTQLLNLTELYLTDTALDYLPGNIGRLNKLKILEVRENHLTTLPKSMERLTSLERLDLGNNDFTELPDVVGSLNALLELWADMNQISTVPRDIGGLRQLMYMDMSKNNITELPPELANCVSLADLILSSNQLTALPANIGQLTSLTTLKLDDNVLKSLPVSIGSLVSLTELNVSGNDLEEIPASVGLLRHLCTLHLDDNHLLHLPPEVGSCQSLTVLSMRANNLSWVPDELSRIPRLRVLNLSANRLTWLPYSFVRLKQLQALWLAENQTNPLVPLQSEVDSVSGNRILTCYLLPQEGRASDGVSDTVSFHPSMWDEERVPHIHFKVPPDAADLQGKLLRQPTPYPKEMKQRAQHRKNLTVKERASPKLAAKSRQRGDTTKDNVTSPLASERHVLFKADKVKMKRDKTRMSRSVSDSEQLSSKLRDKQDEGDMSERGFVGGGSSLSLASVHADSVHQADAVPPLGHMTSSAAYQHLRYNGRHKSECYSDTATFRPHARRERGQGYESDVGQQRLHRSRDSRGYESDSGQRYDANHNKQVSHSYTTWAPTAYRTDTGFIPVATYDRPTQEMPQPAPVQGTYERPQPMQERPQPMQERPQPMQERPQPMQERPQLMQERPLPVRVQGTYMRPQPAHGSSRPAGRSRPHSGYESDMGGGQRAQRTLAAGYESDTGLVARRQQHLSLPGYHQPREFQYQSRDSQYRGRDDDQTWKSQLHEASLRLHKSPNVMYSVQQPDNTPPAAHNQAHNSSAAGTRLNTSNMFTPIQTAGWAVGQSANYPGNQPTPQVVVVPKAQRLDVGRGERHASPAQQQSHLSTSCDSGYDHVLDTKGRTAPSVVHVTLTKNPGLGFSIAGGEVSAGHSAALGQAAVIVSRVLPDGPAANVLLVGDRILQVNGTDVTSVSHRDAVDILRHTSTTLHIVVERGYYL